MIEGLKESWRVGEVSQSLEREGDLTGMQRCVVAVER